MAWEPIVLEDNYHATGLMEGKNASDGAKQFKIKRTNGVETYLFADEEKGVGEYFGRTIPENLRDQKFEEIELEDEPRALAKELLSLVKQIPDTDLPEDAKLSLAAIAAQTMLWYYDGKKVDSYISLSNQIANVWDGKLNEEASINKIWSKICDIFDRCYGNSVVATLPGSFLADVHLVNTLVHTIINRMINNSSHARDIFLVFSKFVFFLRSINNANYLDFTYEITKIAIIDGHEEAVIEAVDRMAEEWDDTIEELLDFPSIAEFQSGLRCFVYKALSVSKLAHHVKRLKKEDVQLQTNEEILAHFEFILVRIRMR